MLYKPQKCDKCHALVPEAVYKCQNCTHAMYNRLSENEIPHYDKFGNPVTLLPIDHPKKSARNTYIGKQLQVKKDYNFSEDHYLFLNEDKDQVKHPLSVFLLFSPWIVGILSFIISVICTKSPVIGIIIATVYSVIVVIAIGIIEKKHQKKRELSINIDAELNKLENYENNCTETDLTILKDAYYFSDKSIGFSKAEVAMIANGERKFAKFAFYELEKDLINEIRYNTKYAGYELYTTQAVLDDEMKPKDFWFIPDIFDDTALSIALGKDLPLKYINF